MHFTKILVSVFALASSTTAISYRDDGRAHPLVARQEKYLRARSEYLEARDTYILEGRGIGISKISFGKGVCKNVSSRPKPCWNDKAQKRCGICGTDSAGGSSCTCQY